MTNKEETEVLQGIYPDGAYFPLEEQRLDAVNMAISALETKPEEPASEDLDKEIAKYFEGWYNDDEYKDACKPDYTGVSVEECKDIARHFANWQKQQMMKNSTDAYIHRNRYTKKNVLHLDVTCDAVQGFKDDDKLKVLFINEER